MKKKSPTAPVTEDKPQTEAPTKKQNRDKYKPGEDTPVTDSTQNTATQTPGLNQDAITSQEEFPSDGG